MKEKRCLKFVGYMYLPTKEEKSKKDFKYYATHLGVGRLQIYDKYNKRPAKAIACNIGTMLAEIVDAYRKRSIETLKEGDKCILKKC